MPSTATQSGPTLLAGTLLAEEPARATEFADGLAESELSPTLWTGAFATNVWGGRYEVDGFIGSGAQGATFTGTDLKTGARVAVKVFDFSKASDWKAVDLFEREAKTLARLEHEGIPAFLDVIEDDAEGSRARALVMTLLPGSNFDQALRAEGPLGESELWRMLVDTADILAFLHREAVVHRDVKPKNLIRRPDGRIALVDFGGVGQVRGDKGGSTVVGTFGYMAPEQLYGTSTPATDLYALGATVLTLATGVEPEDQPRNGLAIDVDKAAPMLSVHMRTLLTRLLSPDPQARPQNGNMLTRELRTLAETGGASQTDPLIENVTMEADFPEPKPRPAFDEDELIGTLSVVGGTLAMILGVLGTVGTVIVGEVLLPVLFALMKVFVPGPQKKALKEAEARVAEGTKAVKSAFESATTRGAKGLDKGHARRERGTRKLQSDSQVYDRKRRAEAEARKRNKRPRHNQRRNNGGRGGSGGR